ncbi:hypothetical protein [Allonocardiopsis opalescens]|uniref:hypothetical protein n=1 Tax=Allonocardiopsis opalescens TaxID=1144618 RepID=UPI0011B220AD|nr:hypothetical protein [Allonocardiopsis opalescens]
MALENGLAYVVALKDRDDDDEGSPYPALNDHFYEAWFFFRKALDLRMPTFRDADRATVLEWLSSEVDLEFLFGERWTEPPDAVVDDLSRFWVYGTVVGMNRDAIRWLKAAFRDEGGPSMDSALVPDQKRFVALLRSFIPWLPWRETEQALIAIWAFGHDRELEYFTALADDTSLHPEVRESAAHYRRICERERAAREAEQAGDAAQADDSGIEWPSA